LHVHTRISDGSLTIEDTLRLAKSRGITHISITDHDTMQGINQAVSEGEKMGIKVIPGIEISAYDFRLDKRVHILGYYIKPGVDLDRICNELAASRTQASCAMVQLLMDAGYDITWEEITAYADGGTGVYKQHIMHALMDKGYCDGIYSELYYRLFKRGKDRNTRGVAFVPMDYVDVKHAIGAVRSAGGVPVLAHPGQLDVYEAINYMVDYGLAGIEAYHPSHNLNDIAKSRFYADKYDLFITGGSDFHGIYGELDAPLGCPQIHAECVDQIQARANQKPRSA